MRRYVTVRLVGVTVPIYDFKTESDKVQHKPRICHFNLIRKNE